jgi:membrane associated rhomboid family serine protease
MIALYLFGGMVEMEFIVAFGSMGRLVYLVMYIIALAASIIPTYINNKDNYHYRSLGASGAVSAVIFAGILFQPLLPMGLFFIPVFVYGFIFAFIYLFVSGWLDRRGDGNINHSAHIFGALFGIAFTIIACQAFSDYEILKEFVNQIKNMDPGKIIQFGRPI